MQKIKEVSNKLLELAKENKVSAIDQIRVFKESFIALKPEFQEWNSQFENEVIDPLKVEIQANHWGALSELKMEKEEDGGYQYYSFSWRIKNICFRLSVNFPQFDKIFEEVEESEAICYFRDHVDDLEAEQKLYMGSNIYCQPYEEGMELTTFNEYVEQIKSIMGRFSIPVRPSDVDIFNDDDASVHDVYISKLTPCSGIVEMVTQILDYFNEASMV